MVKGELFIASASRPTLLIDKVSVDEAHVALTRTLDD